MSDYANSISSGDFFSGNISATDSLVVLFSKLFGQGWHEIGLDAVTGNAAESASMIIAILGAINVIALNVGALCLGWLAFSATMGTAHEGQFLGKRFHDYWMPLRSSIPVFFLAPVAKGGLCVVQVIGLIFIGYSIQFANHIKNVGLDWIHQHSGRVMTASVPPGMKENAQDLAVGLLKTAILQHHYKINKEKTFQEYDIAKPPKSPGYTFMFFGPNRTLGRQQLISTVKIPNYDTSSPIALARAKAVQDLYHSMDKLGYAIITNSTADVADIDINYDQFRQSIETYVSSVSPHVGELISEHNPDFQKELDAFIKRAKEDGVVWLGSYHHTLSRFAGKVNQISADYPAFEYVGLGRFSEDVNILLERALATARNIEDDLDKRISAARSDQGTSIFKGPLNKISYAVTSIGINGFINSIIDGDPLSNLADWGHRLILAGETVIGTYFIIYAGIEFAKGASDSLVGQIAGLFTAGTTNASVGSAAATVSKVFPIVLLICIPVITLGIMLAIYLPAVPYIIWMSAIIGCIILWLEFLVHMSIWSITFATGEGEGLTGQRSQQGLLLIANALLRLPLMVVGYMMAMVIMPEVGKLIGHTMMVFVGGMTATSLAGVVTMVGTWFLFGGFTILETHTVFGLVTHLPDGAMKFFGGAMSSMGEASHEGKTRAMIMASLGKGESVGQQAIGKKPADPCTQGREMDTQQKSGGSQLRKTDSKNENLADKL